MEHPAMGPIDEFARRVLEFAGRDVGADVMAGSESIGAETSSPDVARWTKGAIERLETAVPAWTVVQIMEQCGKSCARVHASSVDETRIRRMKYATEEAFLEAAVQGLPESETMSASYCLCSRAFVQTVWENALGRPVTVELIKSAISGAEECEFKIAI